MCWIAGARKSWDKKCSKSAAKNCCKFASAAGGNRCRIMKISMALKIIDLVKSPWGSGHGPASLAGNDSHIFDVGFFLILCSVSLKRKTSFGKSSFWLMSLQYQVMIQLGDSVFINTAKVSGKPYDKQDISWWGHLYPEQPRNVLDWRNNSSWTLFAKYEIFVQFTYAS